MAPAEARARSVQSLLARQLAIITMLGCLTIALSMLTVLAAADRMGWQFRFDGVVPEQVPVTAQLYAALAAAIGCTVAVLVVVVRHLVQVAAFTFRPKGDL